jgi:hypothetical protein
MSSVSCTSSPTAWSTPPAACPGRTQRRAFAHALGFHRQHLGIAAAHALGSLLRHRLLQAAAVLPSGGIQLATKDWPAWDSSTSMAQNGDESRDLAITVHDQLERRRLHAPDRQHAV